eukprot:scaffold18340_cov55-Cyclotella_meneghiniana.AAC.1
MARPHSYVSESLMAALSMLPRLWHIKWSVRIIPLHGDIKTKKQMRIQTIGNNGMKLKNKHECKRRLNGMNRRMKLKM